MATAAALPVSYVQHEIRTYIDWKIFITIFISVFIAEPGDKTQLATMLFASDKEVSTPFSWRHLLHYIAGIGFILIGAFTLYSA